MELGIHVVMIMSEFTIQPCALVAVIRRLYLSSLVLMAWSINYSCVNLNSIMWTTMLGDGKNGLNCFCVAPCMYSII